MHLSLFFNVDYEVLRKMERYVLFFFKEKMERVLTSKIKILFPKKNKFDSQD